MDPDTIAFLREICKKIKETAEIADHFLALQTGKNKKKSLDLELEKTSHEKRLIPLSQWNKYHDWPTVPALRSYAFMRDHNGFDKVVSKVGRRLKIDEKKFFEWATSNPQTQPVEPVIFVKAGTNY